jgi:hypothetical protein
MDTDIQTRPKRRKRVVTEPHDSYTHYLPVDAMERLRRWAEGERVSYSEAVGEAVRIFLAVRIQNDTVYIPEESTNGR